MELQQVSIYFEFWDVKQNLIPKYVADGTCQCFYLGMDYSPLCTGPLLWV